MVIPANSLATIEALAQAARPINDDDWGSERQVGAEDKFLELTEEWLTAKQLGDWADYALKATTDEWIDYGLMLVRGK